MAMHRLRFLAGPLAGQVVEVTEAMIVGRRAADLVVDDPQVSRRHARVDPAGGDLVVEDLGSLNGTWVNGARIDGPVRLAAGDRVRIGDSTFEVESVPAAGAPAGAEAPPAPVAATEAARAPTPAPDLPFDPPPQRPRRAPGVATRRLTPTWLSFGVVVVTAVALVLYFAMR
jgi:predicted component of type VI protein secretion system